MVIVEIIDNEDFQKLDFVKDTYDDIEEIKYPQECENVSLFILDYLNNNDKIQAMFKRGRHNFLSIFTKGQE